MKQKYDVIVLGGGPAGISASVAASRNSAKVLLVERYGFLGGMATAGLVNPMYGFFARDKQIIKGIAQELVDRMSEQLYGTLGHVRREECKSCGSVKCQKISYVTPFDDEAFKYCAQKIVEESNVELLLHSNVINVTKKDKTVSSVIILNKSGQYKVEGKVFIDCTGDGDVASFAGCKYKIGRKRDGFTQPPTLMFKIGGIKRTGVRFRIKISNFESNRNELNQLPPTDHILFFKLPKPEEYSINSTGIINFNPLDGCDLTRAEISTRQQVYSLIKFIKKYVKGCKNAYLISTATQIGVRESRKIVGEYILTGEDVLNARKFDDSIACGSFPIDIHNPAGTGSAMFKSLECGEYYNIPYRCLLPKGVTNLLVAGRCISATLEAQGSVRVMPTCIAMGEAAGTAAAIAVRQRLLPKNINVEILQKKLISQGALV